MTFNLRRIMKLKRNFYNRDARIVGQDLIGKILVRKYDNIIIKSRIVDTNWFLFLATQNSTSSRWCPWEIGYADSAKQHEKIIIVPTEDDNGRFYGNEYLQLYRKLTDASNTSINKSGYAVFSPGATQGGSWVEQL